MNIFSDFYRGTRVAVTGHTGFKGSWLALWLRELGAEVHGFSLPPPTDPNLFELVRDHSLSSDFQGDIRDQDAFRAFLEKARPRVLFHLAAQPLVRRSYREPSETFAVNAVGTMNVLEAVRHLRLNCTVILVTTDKCYENREWEMAYRENDALGGHDVYSASKAAAELVASSWRRSFFEKDETLGHVATVRAGNVIGGGDYAEDRIIPDLVRALSSNGTLTVRNPAATRPWQHVLDCLSGYLLLGARLGSAKKGSPLAGAFNFGPGPAGDQSVGRLVETFLRHWPGKWEAPANANAVHEASRLNLAIDKASALLGWSPVWNFHEAVEATATWYLARQSHTSAAMLQFTRQQIGNFAKMGAIRGVSWAIQKE
jgi:CDP-glucose 4,6-dehydratase